MKNCTILRKCCQKIFQVGSGNFWFENSIGDDKSLFYRAFTTLLFFMYVFMTILEIMAALIGDFPEDEKRDSVTFAVSHTIVLIKLLSVIMKKDLIRSMNLKMIKVCEQHESPSLLEEKYKIMKINLIAYVITLFGSCFFVLLEGLRKLFNASHFVTIVTYYPPFEDNSILANATRVITTGILFVMMMSMILTVDTFALVHLIMYKYKFITLRIYFEDLKTELDILNELGQQTQTAEKITQGLIDGIIMHSELLKLVKEIDAAFGIVIALQLCLSLGSSVSLLLQMALSEDLTFSAGMKVIFFVAALYILLGLFLCNAGEITYQLSYLRIVANDLEIAQVVQMSSNQKRPQDAGCIATLNGNADALSQILLKIASLISDAIFYCGWHACPPRHCHQNIRKLVLLAIMQAQKPLVMKAFKMLELTYGTFILTARTTYSVFALMYAQNQ